MMISWHVHPLLPNNWLAPDDERIMTKIRRLDGQQLSCPVSVSCTECTKHVLRLSFQRASDMFGGELVQKWAGVY